MTFLSICIIVFIFNKKRWQDYLYGKIMHSFAAFIFPLKKAHLIHIIFNAVLHITWVLSNHVRMWHKMSSKIIPSPKLSLISPSYDLSFLQCPPPQSTHRARSWQHGTPQQGDGCPSALSSTWVMMWICWWDREESWVRACDTDWSWAFVMCLWCRGRDRIGGPWPRFFSAPSLGNPAPSVAQTQHPEGSSLTHQIFIGCLPWLFAAQISNPLCSLQNMARGCGSRVLI